MFNILRIVILYMSISLIAISSQTTKANSNEQLGPAPGTYKISNNAEKIIIPFDYLGMNLRVDAKMNNVKIKMLIDNGVMWDELLFYNHEQMEMLGLVNDGDVKVVGAGDDRSKGHESYTASNASLSFGDVTFYGQSAVIIPKSSGWSDMFAGAIGQVCGAFFKHFIVEFDFDKQNVILHKKQNYQYQGKGNAVKMTRDEGGGYSIPVKIKLKNKKEFAHNLSVDLGGIDSVALAISNKKGIDKPNTEKVYLGHGASGEINGYRDNLESLTIGDYKLNEVSAIFTESVDDGNHTNTTIGLPMLLRFNLVFDYFNETLYMEPNSHFNDPYDTYTKKQ